MKRITSFLLAIVLVAGLVLTGIPTAYAASEMDVSDQLIETLKSEEGFSAKPYRDYSQFTVGYGTRCPDDMLEYYRENGITEQEADTLLRNYLAETVNTINKKFIDVYGLNLTQGQFDALVSFTYNCGGDWINKTGSIFHNAVKNGATGSELIHAFSLWCSAGQQILPGLVRRRLCEANMYLNGEYSTTKPSNYCHVYYSANGGTVSYRIQGYDSNEDIAPAYTPTYAGHTFLGWFTDKTGGTQVTKLTQALSGSTLYAHWEGGNDTQVTLPTAGVTVKVTGSEVNLRKGPGTNYGIVGTAKRGDELLITETASGSGYEWGKAGEKWIALKYTNYDDALKEQTATPSQPTETTVPETTAPATTAPETTVPETTAPATTVPETTVPETTAPETTTPETTAPAATTVTGTVKANGGLALREGPGTGYARIRYLPNGSKVTILEQKTVGSMIWGRTSEGWVSMTYVVLDKTQSEPSTPETSAPAQTSLAGKIKASGGLALREGPGFGYARIRYIDDGTKVTILEQKTVGNMTWGRISEGWISMTYVVLDKAETKPEPTTPETTVPETTAPAETTPEASQGEQTTQTGTVNARSGLSVRSGAGTTYAVKQYLSNGTKVTITEVKVTNGTKWGKISNGWICMDYVTLDNQKPESTANTGTVTADCLRVRASAGTSAAIVGYYYQGAKVEILETQAVGGTTWGKTSQGWISMDYVK